jgi:hypothetical protein
VPSSSTSSRRVRNPKFDSPFKDARINAGGGDDIIEGSDSSDLLFGDRGDDIIKGMGGQDVIDGGAGTDRISGGRGGDIFWMSRGLDTVTDFNYKEGDQISLHRAKGKVYVTQIGEDTYLTPQNFEGVMRFEGTNASEVHASIMTNNNIQLVAINFSPALLF